MLTRLSLFAAVCGLLGGCAGAPQTHPSEFSIRLPGGVLAASGADGTAKQVSAAVPSALLQLQTKLGHTPRDVTILVCGAPCFRRHVPVPGAAAAQAGSRIFINADLVERERIPAILVHEMAHVVIEEQRGRELHKVPEWANEGIAVWASGIGTEGCDEAGEGAAVNHLCLARKTSTWLDGLAQDTRNCWLLDMVKGTPEGVCPPLPNFIREGTQL